MRLPGGDTPARLADRLHALDYTVEGVRALLGAVAGDALDREEVVPARLALRGEGSPLGVAVSLFMLGDVLPEKAVRDVLQVDPVELDGLLAGTAGGVHAVVELAPYGADRQDWLIASDWSMRRKARPTPADHVLGVGGASTMLAQCTIRPEVRRALDIGTGCGVQALHLSEHAASVVATDVSERCLEMARFNTALNRTQVDLRQGSLFDPVASDSFDLIVSNPPFVIGSPDAAHHTYRDSGLPGDTVCARLVADAREHLADGGWCQLLANWEITDGDDWAAHPRSWVESTGLDAWVIERDVQDPAAYVETWLRDAGEQHGDRYPDLYDAWLTGLQDRGVTGVGFGLITLRRGGRTTPIRRFQHVPQPWVQPVAPDVQQWFAVRDLLAEDPSALLRRKLSVSRDVALETYRTLTGDGEPVAMLHRTSGMAWTAPIDEFGIEVLARLNGEREAADVVVALAQQWDVDVASALGGAVGVLSQMAEEGFVHW